MDTPDHKDNAPESMPEGDLNKIPESSENVLSLPAKDNAISVLPQKHENIDSQNVDNKLLEDETSSERNVESKPISSDSLEETAEMIIHESMAEKTENSENESALRNNLNEEFNKDIVSSSDFNFSNPTESFEDSRSGEVVHISPGLSKDIQDKVVEFDAVEVKCAPKKEHEAPEVPLPCGTPPPCYGEGATKSPEFQKTDVQQDQQRLASNFTPISSTTFDLDKPKFDSKPPTFTSTDGSVHQIKWIQFKGARVPVITQNENGPCPMIAITNVLLLRQKISLPKDHEMISSDLLIQLLSDELFSQSTANFDEETRANYEENLYSAVSIFPKLQTGLDINVRFTGVADFEYTTALTVFDLLRIPIFHGWVVDPQAENLMKVLNNQTYNQVVEMIIDYKTSEDSELVYKGLLAEEFLDSTASQLTVCGLCELNERLREGELAVLFRNNHFNTIYKTKGNIYVLLTDVGFVNEPNFVWETLNNIAGDTQFVDADFKVVTKSSSSLALTGPSADASDLTPSAPIYPTQMDLAQRLALEQIDLELAKQLQEEERAAFLKQNPTAGKAFSDTPLVSMVPTPSSAQSPPPSQKAPQSSPEKQTFSGPTVTGGQNEACSSASSGSSPSSWQEASDLELARRLQAEEDAAYYAEQQMKQLQKHQKRSTPGSPQQQQPPTQRTSHQSSPSNQSSPSSDSRRGGEVRYRGNRYQRDPSPPWKCTIQ